MSRDSNQQFMSVPEIRFAGPHAVVYREQHNASTRFKGDINFIDIRKVHSGIEEDIKSDCLGSDSLLREPHDTLAMAATTKGRASEKQNTSAMAATLVSCHAKMQTAWFLFRPWLRFAVAGAARHIGCDGNHGELVVAPAKRQKGRASEKQNTSAMAAILVSCRTKMQTA
ncbi:hypothetical protein Tco_1371616 [Tanacetum coccineum]